MDSALQIAALHTVLHADVARVVLAVYEGRAAGFVDVGQLAERDLALTIPLSLLFSFIFLHAQGVAANLLSIGAIDFGIPIDGSW